MIQLKQLQGWGGKVCIDGTEYDSVSSVPDTIDLSGATIILTPNVVRAPVSGIRNRVEDITDRAEHTITVKAYMTREACPEFDFMAKFNNNIPMPLRTMTGTIEKETKGMYYMKLHGQGLRTITCLRCGRELTNPISRHHGIGPECIQKLGMCYSVTDVDEIKEALTNIKWEGYVIKSAILEDKINEK